MTIDIEKWKKAKKERHFSYDDLARMTGLSKSTITNIFCGYIDAPRYETVKLIEDALGLAEKQLTVAEPPSPSSIEVNDEERDLIMCYRSITRDAQVTIMYNVHAATAYCRNKVENNK